MRWYESKDPMTLVRACQRMGVGKETLTLVLCKVIRECDPDYNSLIGLNILEDHIIRQAQYEGESFDFSLLQVYKHGDLDYAECVMNRYDSTDVVDIINKQMHLPKLDVVFKLNCLNKCMSMWQVLADDPSLTKTQALERTGGSRPVGLCWLCHYVTGAGTTFPVDCDVCPVKWRGGHCTDGEYGDWAWGLDPYVKAMCASRIVSLCKEVLV